MCLLPHGEEGAPYTELPIADYLRMVRILVSLGIEKVRLTGGEPLLRSGLVEMVAELARISTASARRHPPCAREPAIRSTSPSPPMAICWNPSPRRLQPPGSTASPSAWTRSTPRPSPASRACRAAIERVLAGVRAAQAAGLGPVKINCVLLHGFNDAQIEPFAEFSRREGLSSASSSSCPWKNHLPPKTRATGSLRPWSRWTRSSPG